MSVIFLINRMSTKYLIQIHCDQGTYSCESVMKPNEIIEKDNKIITGGKSLFEVFSLISDSNNNKALCKLSEIPLINNNNNIFGNNNINNNNFLGNNNFNNNNDEVICMSVFNEFLFCGHLSGEMSTWKFENNNNSMVKINSLPLHKSAINKIVFSVIENKNFLFTCSSDKSINVLSIDNSVIIKTQFFEDEVMKIKLVLNFERSLKFIVSLKKGGLKVLNKNFDVEFEIPSRFNTKITRYVLSATNPSKNDVKGDYLLITEGKKIDIFTWNKEGSYSFPKSKGKKNQMELGP